MIGEISSDITEDSDMEMGIIYNNKTWISRNVDASGKIDFTLIINFKGLYKKKEGIKRVK